MEYVVVKWVHILSSTYLFGTGIGSAFYLLLSSLSRDVRVVAAISRYVVWADWTFISTTAVLQPVTGFWLAHLAGIPLTSSWLWWSMVLYAVAIGCWLPVVHIQIRMRDLAAEALLNTEELAPAYWRYFRVWIALGIPAFFAFVSIFYLMVAKPA